MYQALYRKYRPSTLKDVAGQDIIVKTLTNAVLNNKLSHAYLFSGPRGTGKTSIAKIIGKMANCESLTNGNACNECVNCTQINNGESVDLIEIDAASNNGVDEIRELKSKVNLVPNTGKYKIYIIDEVHMLTVGAFNALLKTLEEPPSHIIFILATTEPHKIPTTILSRCQRYDFKKLTINSIVDRLNYIIDKESIKVEDGVLQEIARLSDGGMRDSISLLDQAVSYADEIIKIEDIHNMNGTISSQELKLFVNDILENNYEKIFGKIDLFNDNGKSLIKLCDEIIYFLRNTLLYKIIPEHFKEEEKELYEETNMITNRKQLIDMIEKFNDSSIKMKLSSNPKILLETTIISLLKNKEEKNIVKVPKLQEKKSTIKIEEKSEMSIKTKEKIDDKLIEKLNSIEKIRINNTLSEFNKKELVKCNENYDSFRVLILNTDYSDIISIILEGKIRAASDSHIVMVFEEEWLKNKFNSMILKIEPIFEEVYNKKYKVIATDLGSWEIYKNEFNNKLKSFIYMNEPDVEQLINNQEEKLEIENIFDSIIEYK